MVGAVHYSAADTGLISRLLPSKEPERCCFCRCRAAVGCRPEQSGHRGSHAIRRTSSTLFILLKTKRDSLHEHPERQLQLAPAAGMHAGGDHVGSQAARQPSQGVVGLP